MTEEDKEQKCRDDIIEQISIVCHTMAYALAAKIIELIHEDSASIKQNELNEGSVLLSEKSEVIRDQHELIKTLKDQIEKLTSPQSAPRERTPFKPGDIAALGNTS